MKFFLFTYLFSIMIILFSIQSKSLSMSKEDGAIVYNDFCLRCHGPQGRSLTKTIPPLNNSDFLLNLKKSISIIKFGAKKPIFVNGKEYSGNSMVAQGLDDEEISDVLNFIRNSWDNSNEIQVSAKDVNDIKEPL